MNTYSHSDGVSFGESPTEQIYDLTQHQNVSGEDMSYFDDAKKEKYVPYVVKASHWPPPVLCLLFSAVPMMKKNLRAAM